MSSYRDRMTKQVDDVAFWKELLKELEPLVPNVRDMLVGLYDDLGNQTVRGASITFWLDGARLKFVIRPKDQGLLGWGVCADSTKPWDSIELALMRDEIDWKEGMNKSSDSAPY